MPHNAEIFRKVYDNIKGDLKNIDEKIKELRKCLTKGRTLYGKCSLARMFIKDISDELNTKIKELETLVKKC